MVLISAMYFCVVRLNLRSVFLFLWEYVDIYVTLIACGLFRSIRFVWYLLPNFLSVEPLFVCLGGHLFDTVGLYLFCSDFTNSLSVQFYVWRLPLVWLWLKVC